MYRFQLGGVAVECDSPEELRNACGTFAGRTITRTPKARKVSASQRTGVSKSWSAARKLAKEKSITVAEARSQIAKQKKK